MTLNTLQSRFLAFFMLFHICAVYTQMRTF